MRNAFLVVLLLSASALAVGGDTLQWSTRVKSLAAGDTFSATTHWKSMTDTVQRVINGRLGNVNLSSTANIKQSKIDSTRTDATDWLWNYTKKVLQWAGAQFNIRNGRGITVHVNDTTANSGYFYVVSDSNDTCFYVGPGGVAGLGSAPSSVCQFLVTEPTLNTTTSKYAGYFSNIKTGGTTDQDDLGVGIYGAYTHNDTDATMGILNAAYFRARLQSGNIGTAAAGRVINGVYSWLCHDSGEIYGVGTAVDAYVDQNATVANSVKGMLIGVNSRIHEDDDADSLGSAMYVGRGIDVNFGTSIQGAAVLSSADDVFLVRRIDRGTGGTYIDGVDEAAASSAMALCLRGFCDNGPTGNGAVTIRGAKDNGASALTSLASTEKILSIQNNTTEKVVIYGSGLLTADSVYAAKGWTTGGAVLADSLYSTKGILGKTINTGLGNFEIGQSLQTTDSVTFVKARIDSVYTAGAGWLWGYSGAAACSLYRGDTLVKLVTCPYSVVNGTVTWKIPDTACVSTASSTGVFHLNGIPLTLRVGGSGFSWHGFFAADSTSSHWATVGISNGSGYGANGTGFTLTRRTFADPGGIQNWGTTTVFKGFAGAHVFTWSLR